MNTPPEQLVTIVPGDVAVILLVKAGLDGYRRAHRGENPRVDQVLIEMTTAAIRWREQSAHGRDRASTADAAPPLTTRQAADRLGLTARSVRRVIANGRLPAQRIGHTWQLDRDDVDRYRAERGA